MSDPLRWEYFRRIGEMVERSRKARARLYAFFVSVIMTLPAFLFIYLFVQLQASSPDDALKSNWIWMLAAPDEYRDSARAEYLGSLDRHASLQRALTAMTLATAVNALLYAIMALRLIWRWLALRIQRFRRVRSGKLVKLHAGQLAHVHRWIDDLRDAMGLQRPIYLWRAVHTRVATPSLFERRDGAHIIIPGGFIVVARTEPEQARAMLAHEMAHIAQNDIHLWRLCSDLGPGFYSAMRFTTIAGLLLGGVLALSALSLVGFAMLAFATLGNLWWLRFYAKASREIFEARHMSEMLADFGAVAFADGDALARSIRQYTHDDPDNRLHPPKYQRLDGIEDAMASRHQGRDDASTTWHWPGVTSSSD